MVYTEMLTEDKELLSNGGYAVKTKLIITDDVISNDTMVNTSAIPDSKNKFDYTRVLSSVNGLTNTLNEDGSITTTGIPTSDYVKIVEAYDITDELEDGEYYTLSQYNASQYLYLKVLITNIETGDNEEIALHYSNINYKTFLVDKLQYTYQIMLQSCHSIFWTTEKTRTNFYQLEKGEVPSDFEKYIPHAGEHYVEGESVQNGVPTPSIPVEIVNTYKAGKYQVAVDGKLYKFELAEPLRSLPDGTKDILYIGNGKVCLERNVIGLQLNGTENMLAGQYGTNAYKITPALMPNNNGANCEVMSNVFLGVSHADRGNHDSNFVYVDGEDLYFRNTDFASLDEFKTYLSENNVELQYRLSETLVTIEELDFTISDCIILTEENSVKSWEHTEERYVPDIGFIGQFVARELTGELHNISDEFNIQDKYINLQMGILNTTNKTENWYSFGTFHVMEPEDDDVKDNTTFEAMDLTTKFNIDFDASFINNEFRKSFADVIKDGGSFTALELAKYVCAQVDIKLGNTSFTHSDFVIASNQFTEGNSCRDVMKAISQLAFGWCRIGWDNKCYIDEMTVDTSDIENTDILTNNHYYSLQTQKVPFGPVNRVYIGPSAIEGMGAVTPDNESTETNGDIVINIYDNPITYTNPLRELAIDGADRLWGLTYISFETETIGHPWYKANKPIIITDMEGNERQTYPFTNITKYTGHIKTTLSASELTQAQKENGYNRSIYKDIRNVKIDVDKQNGTITALNSRVTATEGGLGKVETSVEALMTDTYSKTEVNEIISGTAADGTVVSSVSTTSGTFNKNGLTIEQTGAETKTNLNAAGLIIQSTGGLSNTDLLTVDPTGVTGENLRAKTYLNVGEHSRMEDYKHTNGKVGTGMFWIGGEY